MEQLVQVFGPLAVPTLICLAAGVLLLLIELFTPGFGVAGGLGLLLLAAVVVMQLLFGSPAVAAYIAAAVLVLIVAALLLFIRSFQRGKLSRSFAVLDEQIDAGSTSLSDASEQQNVSRRGVSVTPLRPAGIAEFDGERRDVMTAGEFLPAGVPVVITEVRGLHVLVRPAEDAPAAGAETPDAQRTAPGAP